MSALYPGKAKWLLAGAALSIIAGCAAGGTTVRNARECPVGFVQYCEVSDYDRCGCLRRAEIGRTLREQ
jgi:hypothetical protein